jgi:hypothetical protein
MKRDAQMKRDGVDSWQGIGKGILREREEKKKRRKRKGVCH